MLIINATEVGLTRVPPDTFFGDPVTNGINWAAHDPATHRREPALDAHVHVLGQRLARARSTADPSSGLSGASEIEGAVNQSNVDFQRRLNALGIPAYFNAYGNGTHIWPYWKRDLQWSIDKIMADFAHPAPDAGAVHLQERRRPATASTAGTCRDAPHGARVLDACGRELPRLLAVGQRLGHGHDTGVLHARRALSRHDDGPAREPSTVVVAGRDRRLVLDVPLGPANAYQAETPQATVAGTAVYTTRVTVERAVSARAARRPACASDRPRTRCR